MDRSRAKARVSGDRAQAVSRTDGQRLRIDNATLPPNNPKPMIATDRQEGSGMGLDSMEAKGRLLHRFRWQRGATAEEYRTTPAVPIGGNQTFL
ncbi:hypothetical protein RESH_04925 [Rhodopirellula europaea SH398]|uniref:Uncharacterized protein n=1 Tax=Rhodopirellula europaea SH398 TaxID=1263868 RepID=M5SEF6_9BACT|nr:hypothetical protein RESH_04925 [Rhodopirellula europaea SH398]